jgi:hypothetical protein
LLDKRFAILKELLPTTRRVGGLWQPDAFGAQTNDDMKKETAEAATALGVQLQLVEARKPDELERAFGDMAVWRVDGLLEFPSPMLIVARTHMVELAALHRLPAITTQRGLWNLAASLHTGPIIPTLTAALQST